MTEPAAVAQEPQPDARPTAESAAQPPPAPQPASQAAAVATADAVIELRDLRIEVPGRVLLEQGTLTVRPGERLLLVGPSGAGKSVLLRLLTGLLAGEEEYRLAGSARVGGVELVRPDGRPGGDEQALRDRVGIVFQDHALLDELTAGENVAFARDHSRSPGAGAAAGNALAFLREHGIPPGARVRTLSGGQRQRVAVARALARAPQVIFFDEPTSALDPRASRAVAALIEEASREATPVVVTHDYGPFRGVATRVILLDPHTRGLREVSWEELDASFQAPAPPAALPAEPAAVAPLAALAGRGREGLLDLLEGTPGALLALLRALPWLVVPWGARPAWLLRWLLHYARITFLGSAIPYNVIAGVIAGFVATYFTYKFLPRPELTEALILDDVLPALGFALYRIVVPVLVTILLAGRTGAALASDFGNRVYHHQTAAMRSLGAPAGVYLGTAACWASLVGTLVVAAVAFWSATLTSLAVFTAIQTELTPHYWQGQFWRRLGGEHHWPYLVLEGWGWVLAKLLVSGLGVAGIAYFFGTRPKRSTADVSRGITLSVYWGTVFVLLVHFVCAFQEFERIRP